LNKLTNWLKMNTRSPSKWRMKLKKKLDRKKSSCSKNLKSCLN